MATGNKISQQIQYLRSKRGWTQEQLADKLSVSKQTVSNWETGQKSPRMGALQKMSDLFEVSIGYITDGDGTEELLDTKISMTVAKLSDDHKLSVYKFARQQLAAQEKPELPAALAAHADDVDHKYTNEEIQKNVNFLNDAIHKYKKNNK